MDDFNVSALHESKNEWCSRLVTLLTPLIIDGYKSILDESIKLCKNNGEEEKYLMTFQNLISRIPKWNQQIVENERKRICEKSGCNYLEDLVTCVHIIQLKILTAMRVGQKQKKINIDIPKLDDFIHKVYINVARKLYKNVYLFQISIGKMRMDPLQIQKNHREMEIIIQECILNTIRESIPVETILKAYMDETVEEDVIEEVKEEVFQQPIEQQEQQGGNVPNGSNNISFNNIDYVKTENGINQINAPKDINRLENISVMRNEMRKKENEDDESDKLQIMDQDITLDHLDVHNIDDQKIELLPDLLIDEIEVLE
jgi:GTP:adenosylcobinamide-phosphate guanylyltransferase